MNKKLVWICSIVAVILLSAIGIFLYRLFYNNDNNNEQTSSSISSSCLASIKAIPTDAVVFCDFNRFSKIKDLISKDSSNVTNFLDNSNPLLNFIKNIPPNVDKGGAIISIHYSSKNTISTLFALSLSKNIDVQQLISQISAKYNSVEKRNYSEHTIYSISEVGITFAVNKNILISSTSSVLIETSIRHIDNKTSIIDNKYYSQMIAYSNDNATFNINNQNIGKFFSGVINYSYLKYADFASQFANWVTLNLDLGETYIYGNGKLYGSTNPKNYISILHNQGNQENRELLSLLPYNVKYLVAFSIDDPQSFLSSYIEYVEAQKNTKDYNYINYLAQNNSQTNISTKDWFLSLGVQKLALVSIDLSSEKLGSSKILLMKINNTDALKNNKDEINTFIFRKYISSLLGIAFQPTEDEFYTVVNKKWIIVGEKSILATIKNGYLSEKYISLATYLKDTPMNFTLSGSSSMLALVNLERCKNEIPVIVKSKYSKSLSSGLEECNFSFMSLKVINDGNEQKMSFSFLTDNVAEIVDDSPLVISTGPYAVKNYITKKTNYIQQSKNNAIRLVDEHKRAKWSVLFDKQICGNVDQIDYFHNKKLQMIFGGGNKVYLLDRLGHWVRPFPITLGKRIILGPKVYDFTGNKEYQMIILHEDNTLMLYDIQGKPVKGFVPITSKDRIKELPTLLKVGNYYYWVLRTFRQTTIYDIHGVIVVKDADENMLAPDTDIKVKSSYEVEVTTKEKNEMILNLDTGKLSKY